MFQWMRLVTTRAEHVLVQRRAWTHTQPAEATLLQGRQLWAAGLLCSTHGPHGHRKGGGGGLKRLEPAQHPQGRPPQGADPRALERENVFYQELMDELHQVLRTLRALPTKIEGAPVEDAVEP